MVGIYKITSPTGKVYIGQSWDIADRKSAYKTLAIKSQPRIYNSLIKYGWEAHTFKVVHELPHDTSQKILDIYEMLYWQLYKDCKVKLLNVKEPGRGGKHSEGTKQKIRDSHLGLKQTIETVQKRISKTKGRKCTEQAIQKMSKPKEVVKCPHCDTEGGIGIMKRFHFGNCLTLTKGKKHKAKRRKYGTEQEALQARRDRDKKYWALKTPEQKKDKISKRKKLVA
jgi:group I intron endonuclease